MSMVSRSGRCRTCGHQAAHGSHTRCIARALVRERYGQVAELERERVRPRIPRPRAGAR